MLDLEAQRHLLSTIVVMRGELPFMNKAWVATLALCAAALGVEVPASAQSAPAARRVSLRALLEHAEAHAPAIRVARSRLLRGDAARAAADPLFPENPELGLEAGVRRRPDGSSVELEASLEQRIEIAGERGLRRRVAGSVRGLLRAQLDEVRWDVHLAVHSAYHDAIVARERAQAAARLLQFAEELLEIARRRLAAGDVSPLVVRFAEADAAQARQANIVANQEYAESRLMLGEVSGWPVDSPPEPEGALHEPRRAPPIEHLVALATRHQPALRTGKAASAEAQARVALADREVWPEPALGVRYTRENEDAGTNHIIMGTVRLPLPLWQTNRVDRAEARANLEVARTELSTAHRVLSSRLQRAAQAVNASADRVAVYGTEILPTLEQNLALLRRAYELGEIDILQLSVARERFLQTQRDALDAFEAYNHGVAELERQVGRDVWPDEEHRPGAREDRP